MSIARWIAERRDPTRALYFFQLEGCGHCEAAKPVVDAFARAHPNVRVVRLDAGNPKLPPLAAPTIGRVNEHGEWSLAQGRGWWLSTPRGLERWYETAFDPSVR